MANHTYLFVLASEYSVQLTEKVLLLLVGGYKMQCNSLTIVVMEPVSCPDSVKYFEAISEEVSQYRKALQSLQSYDTCLCQSVVEQPHYLKPQLMDSSSSNCHVLKNCPSVQRSVELVSCLSSQFDINFESGDKVVFATEIGKQYDEQTFTQGILASYAYEKNDANISIIYDCSVLLQSNKHLPTAIKQSLQGIKKQCRLIMVGSNGSYKPTFSGFQTACAIIDVVNHQVQGEPTIKREQNGLCFCPDNLQSVLAANSLLRLGCLAKLQLEGFGKNTSAWKDNLKLKDPWKDIPMLCSLSPFTAIVQRWMDGVSDTDFALEIGEDDWKIFARRLNGVDVLPKTSSQECRRQEATKSLLDALGHFDTYYNNEDSSSYHPVSDTNLFCDSWDFNLGNLSEGYSPTDIFELTDLAFSLQFLDNSEALVWRSTCLDLWELFFDKQVFIGPAFEIREELVSKVLTPSEKKLLAYSYVGRTIIEQDVYYYVTDKDRTFSAYTSPLTGFCFSEYNHCSFAIASRRYLSDEAADVRDLKDRSIEFQQFIYSYVNMNRKQFSDSFKEYVNHQIKKNLAIIQSRGVDIIRMYSQYRTHIGIDIDYI